jgi:lipopolysaccharide transport system permease protein
MSKKHSPHPSDMLNTLRARVRPPLFAFPKCWYLLKTLTFSDLRSQHSGSVLGGVWFVVKPLVLIGIYTVVFSAAVDSMGGFQNRSMSYGLFIFAGMLPWLFIQESTQRGATIFVDLAHVIRHHSLPLGLLPLHIVLAVALAQSIGVVVFLAIKWILTSQISPYALFVLIVIPVQIVFCFGLVLIVAIMNVFLRDTSHLTMTALVVWFFSSPIVFPLDKFSGGIKALMWLNPMTGLTEIYRDLLLIGRLPSVVAVGSFSFFSALVLLVGCGLYFKTHDAIVDWI